MNTDPEPVVAWRGWTEPDDPGGYLGAAILYGTMPFDAGVPAGEGRLAG